MGPVNFEIARDDFHIDERFASGDHADIYKGRWNEQKVAIKKFALPRVSDEVERKFREETERFASCTSPRIAELFRICVASNVFFMIREYVKNGSLADYLRDHEKELAWSHRWQMAIEIVEGLNYLHEKAIVHGGLKSPNILLDADRHLKLVSFGMFEFTKEVEATASRSSKSYSRWKAPECFRVGARPNRQSDMYSCGTVLWEIAASALPFNDMGDEEVFERRMRGTLKEEIPEDAPSTYRDLIEACWQDDPNERPTVQKLLKDLQFVKPLSAQEKAAKLKAEEEAKLKEEKAAQLKVEEEAKRAERLEKEKFIREVLQKRSNIVVGTPHQNLLEPSAFHPIDLTLDQLGQAKDRVGDYVAGLDLSSLFLKQEVQEVFQLCPNTRRIAVIGDASVNNSLSQELEAFISKIPAALNLHGFRVQWIKQDALSEKICGFTTLTYLDFGKNELSSIPKAIRQLANLKELSLYHNSLTNLPEEIGCLESLTDINIVENKLTELPITIGSCTALKRVNLNHNGITALPEQIGALASLTDLDVGYNRIAELPSTIEGWSSLIELRIEYNDLHLLPEAIGQLKNLELLELARNKLVELPKEVGELVSLRYLGLKYNKLTCLPKQIGQLSRLTQLDAVYNQIASVPKELGRLVSLKYLNLHGNQISVLEMDSQWMVSLETLRLASNLLVNLHFLTENLISLTSLDVQTNQLCGLDRIKKITHLRELRIDFNYNMTSIVGIRHLAQLTSLSFCINKISELPSGIGELVLLKKLLMNGNTLERLPEEIGRLTALRELEARSNNISFVSDEISKLTNLTRLNLEHNKLESIPSGVKQRQGLRIDILHQQTGTLSW